MNGKHTHEKRLLFTTEVNEYIERLYNIQNSMTRDFLCNTI